MDFKKLAVTTAMTGALGLGALGLGTGLAHADPIVPLPPPIPVPAIPYVNVPNVDVPYVRVPDVDFPEVDNFFGLPNVHIPPGQLMNARFINGVPNPFFGIPPGQLKKLPTVNGVINPFFDEAPGHWTIPDDFFPGES